MRAPYAWQQSLNNENAEIFPRTPISCSKVANARVWKCDAVLRRHELVEALTSVFQPVKAGAEKIIGKLIVNVRP